MASANNGSGKTWSAIIDCYAIAFGVLPAAAGPDTDTVRHGPCADARLAQPQPRRGVGQICAELNEAGQRVHAVDVVVGPQSVDLLQVGFAPMPTDPVDNRKDVLTR